MKTVIIGGGNGCRSILDLATSTFLTELKLEIIAVADINPEAPGFLYAKEIGIQTYLNYHEAIDLPNIELIIEVTGNDKLLQELYSNLKPGIKLIDHTFTHFFWDLVNAQEEQDRQLKELKRLEEKLESERHFLQSIFDSQSDLAVVIDLEMKVIRVNEKFADFVGSESQELIGKSYTDIIKKIEIGYDSANALELINLVIESKKAITTVHVFKEPDESHWEITRSPIINNEGKTEAILATWHRITEKVMLMRQIEIQEQRFKTFINSAQDWISIKDKDGKYIIVNPVTASAFNKKPEDFIGKYPEEILPESLVKTIKMHDEEVKKTKRHITYNETMNIQGSDRFFRMVRFPLLDHNNEVIGTCTIGRDITKEEQLKEQLIQNEKLAALGKLAAGVAHEINNPLTGILAYAEDILEDFSPNSNRYEDLKVIIRETLRCRDIVRNLLDFARQDSPRFELIEPNKAVEQTLHLVSRLPQFKDITITKFLTEYMPNIRFDPMQMQQVLLNLMINAADAMNSKGKITISTDYLRQKNMCLISVEDTGPGIPENLIDKIFEPFFSTKNTNGLGLAVTWGIIERHHGLIEVDTGTEGGAVFKILIPAAH